MGYSLAHTRDFGPCFSPVRAAFLLSGQLALKLGALLFGFLEVFMIFS
jgi:hypothetical protein